MKKHRPKARRSKRKAPFRVDRAPPNSKSYYHGGKPGLPVGSFILPARETGSVRHDLLEAALEAGRPDAYDPETCYVTTDIHWAMVYASYHHSRCGVVYEVEPIGDVIDDPDEASVGFSFKCKKARIIRIARIPFAKIQKLRLRHARGESRGTGIFADYAFVLSA